MLYYHLTEPQMMLTRFCRCFQMHQKFLSLFSLFEDYPSFAYTWMYFCFNTDTYLGFQLFVSPVPSVSVFKCFNIVTPHIRKLNEIVSFQNLYATLGICISSSMVFCHHKAEFILEHKEFYHQPVHRLFRMCSFVLFCFVLFSPK